jgi:glutathione S-transferase
MRESGNCYKVKLLLEQLGEAYDWREIDIFKGQTKEPSYLERNPVGEVPTMQLPDGTYLAQSNAILFFLAEETPFLFANRLHRAQVLQWMFFEQYSHEPYIAVARKIRKFLPPYHEETAKLPELERRGYQALTVMEQHLAQNDFFVGGKYSIADIALYAYTHVAHEGGFDLTRLVNIRRWLVNVRNQPGYKSM